MGKKKPLKIVLTGGGTAGHVIPNIALLPALEKKGWKCIYIGSKDGIEKNLIEDIGLKYFGISTGKLRRYLSLENFIDPFKVIKGIFEAKRILKKLRPDIVFSKGGFVSVPVVRAAGQLKIPVVIHESDITPGLANKLSFRYASQVCYTFPETRKYLAGAVNPIFTGTPVREELLEGNREAGLDFAGLSSDKPVVLVMGGSTGAKAVNDALYAILPDILKKYSVIHLCGAGKREIKYDNTPGYVQYEYINKEMPDIFAASDIVVSRAGANAVFEFLALKKPNLLIPLPATQSRGDQILNAASFVKSGYSMSLAEEDITPKRLLKKINDLYENREKFIEAMKKSPVQDSEKNIIEVLEKNIRNNK